MSVSSSSSNVNVMLTFLSKSPEVKTGADTSSAIVQVESGPVLLYPSHQPAFYYHRRCLQGKV
jgi:hypothetical protein